jgi:hypothetical protein
MCECNWALNEIGNWLIDPICNSTGAPRCLVFNHATRISTSTFKINDYDKKDEKKKVSHQPGVFAAHLDQSSWQAGNVLHKWFPKETEALLHGRYMIVNVSTYQRSLVNPDVVADWRMLSRLGDPSSPCTDIPLVLQTHQPFHIQTWSCVGTASSRTSMSQWASSTARSISGTTSLPNNRKTYSYSSSLTTSAVPEPVRIPHSWMTNLRMISLLLGKALK